jgi:hypothetical protein
LCFWWRKRRHGRICEKEERIGMFEKERRKVRIWGRIRYVELFEELKGKRKKSILKKNGKKDNLNTVFERRYL